MKHLHLCTFVDTLLHPQCLCFLPHGRTMPDLTRPPPKFGGAGRALVTPILFLQRIGKSGPSPCTSLNGSSLHLYYLVDLMMHGGPNFMAK
jgi:hypothetical protein